jgi:hypothetical protein
MNVSPQQRQIVRRSGTHNVILSNIQDTFVVNNTDATKLPEVSTRIGARFTLTSKLHGAARLSKGRQSCHRLPALSWWDHLRMVEEQENENLVRS